MARLSPRRPLRGIALVVALAVAYAGGVVTGVVGTEADDRQPRAVRSPDRGVIDEAATRIQGRAAHQVERSTLERAAVEGMLDVLGDRWSTYYTPDEFDGFQSSLQGSYSGVGLWLHDGRNGDVVIGSVQPASPASRTDVRAGDRLLSVGEHRVPGAPITTVTRWLRGRVGTRVPLVLVRDGVLRTAHLVRDDIRTDDVSVRELADGVLRVRLGAFTRGAGREVRSKLWAHRANLQDGIVLDVRDNHGGLLEEAVAVASAFLDGGPVVTYERRGREPRTLAARDGGDTATPLVVLVSEETASAAELLAASLQDRNRAVVVGSTTYGKGSVQEPMRLSDGSALALTVGRYLTPGGRSVDGVGVRPDVPVRSGAPPSVAEHRAVEVLTGLMASATSRQPDRPG